MYTIKSARLGEVGTEFVPKPGINVAALLWGGFIVETTEETPAPVSTPTPKKGAKNKKATKED